MNQLPKSKEEARNMLLGLLAEDAYKHGDFTLSSGKKSHHYVNCKPVTLSGLGLSLISNLFLDYIDSNTVSVAGMTLGADPLVSGVAMHAIQSGRSLNALIVRKVAKGHGTAAWLEGPLPPKGSLITVLEDVVTTGGSSLKAVEQLIQAGYLVEKIVTIVDREEGGKKEIEKAGLKLESIFLLDEISRKSKEII